MMNIKQVELSHMLFEKLHRHFPEMELVNITESPINPNHIWANITMPEDEEKEITSREYAGESIHDIGHPQPLQERTVKGKEVLRKETEYFLAKSCWIVSL